MLPLSPNEMTINDPHKQTSTLVSLIERSMQIVKPKDDRNIWSAISDFLVCKLSLTQLIVFYSDNVSIFMMFL